jgi:hypothetical protein
LKEWVSSFLRSREDPNISPEELEREIGVPIFCYQRLSKCFNINFQSNVRLCELFGSVLADLPIEVFADLLNTRNLFFFWSGSLAMVQAVNFTEGKPAIFCYFSDRLLQKSDSIVRGAIAHELSHIISRHYEDEVQQLQTVGAMEDEADQRAIEWGFEFEIRAVRGSLKSVSPI